MSSRYAFKTSSRHVFKTSWRRLGRLKTVTLRTCWRRLQDISWRRLEDVFKTNKCLLGYKDVDETSFPEPLCQTPVTKNPRFSSSEKLSETSLERELRQQIASVNECLKETPQKKSEAALFCDSLVPQLESLPEKEFRRTRIKIE